MNGIREDGMEIGKYGERAVVGRGESLRRRKSFQWVKPRAVWFGPVIGRRGVEREDVRGLDGLLDSSRKVNAEALCPTHGIDN
jgi:hypothetical protein